MGEILWPSTLQCVFVDDGEPETRMARKHSFQPDVGPPIQRPAGTVILTGCSVAKLATYDQLVQF